MKHQLRWFKNRIGKRVYRDSTHFKDCTCQCKDCTEVIQIGLVIRDEQHAEYLEMVQYDLGIEYRSKRVIKN